MKVFDLKNEMKGDKDFIPSLACFTTYFLCIFRENAPITLKMGSRSPKSNNGFALFCQTANKYVSLVYGVDKKICHEGH